MTRETRRRFTSEYKEQAVARLSEPGVIFASLSAEPGITSGQLKGWHLELLAAGTATPIANSIAEVRTFLDYLAGDLLRAMGIGSFDAFAAQFFDVIDGLEITPDGSGRRPSSRLGRFVNLPEMLAIWTQVADVKLEGDVDLPRPALAGGRKEILSVPLNEDAREIQQSLVKRLENIRNGGDPGRLPRVDMKAKLAA